MTAPAGAVGLIEADTARQRASTPDRPAARVTVKPRDIRFPARPTGGRWPATEQGRSALLDLVAGPAVSLARPQRQVVNARRRGLCLLVAWLEDQPGGTWQERWVASGAEEAGDDWAQRPSAWLAVHDRLSDARLVLLTTSLAVLIGADVVRPSLAWLLGGGKKRKLARNIIPDRDPVGFAELRRACQDDPTITEEVHNQIAYRCAMVMAAKGGVLADIAVGDVAEIVEVEVELRGRAAAQSATFTMLRRIGVFDPAVPSLRELRSPPQQSVEDLVGRYVIACGPVRDLLIDYLKERQPAVDHTTLRNHASVLAGRFWADIEAHHSGIDTLALPVSVAAAWKQRLRTRSTTHSAAAVAVSTERLAYLDVLSTVRAFYLDLAQWALDEPGRWARWAVPCPIKREELTRRKQVRQRKARMDARTRERLPALPALMATVEAWRKEADERLAAGRLAAPGDSFTVAGQTLVRSPTPHAVGANVWASDPADGKRRLLNREEDHAFWAWAVIHVLRLTGIRVEELLELSHHALVQYRMPGTGETVALLQIVPSKTDAERLLVVSPELADVLAAIIRRVRDDNAAVPSLRARDYHEHLWLAPAPLLFQHRLGAERVAFSVGLISRLLDEALTRSALVDQGGQPLRCTPHDFRRMFITDAVMNGLPPHIAQIIAGHQNINVTMGYKAVYPEEAIQAHVAFLARRRALRPSEEYRTPTDEEWQEFLGQFERRKVSIGTCARAFATPCIHEHACVRCPLLWPDPTQRERLSDIHDNLLARIAEAETEGWLGEIEGLKVSLAGATDKLAQIRRHDPTHTVAVEVSTKTSKGQHTS